MSEEIIKVLDALAEKFGLAIDWTSSNVIPYLQTLCDKYVNYEMWTSILWIIVGMLCLIVVGIIFGKIHRNKDFGVEHDSYGINKTVREIFYFFLTILTAGLVLHILIQIFDIVTCLSFPEKIIINELMALY